MTVFTVTFPGYGKTVTAEPGETLLSAAARAGIALYSPCGGAGRCGRCKVIANGDEVLACRYRIGSDTSVVIPQTEVTMLPVDPDMKYHSDGTNRYAAAFDIGTTTVAGFLMDGVSGSMIAAENRVNPQAAFGADLISRIQQSMHGRSVELRDCILSCMSEMIAAMAASCGISSADITSVAIAGNTAMLHLLRGKDPAPLTVPPYMPLSVSSEEFRNSGWLPVSDAATVRILPCIAGFVGGDTSGCMLSSGFGCSSEITLLIDIGTNGEMVLGNSDGFCACSTAAGPAFEGAGISCGMIASSGAISHVYSDSDGIRCEVIGGGEAKGICGSGLLDAVAVMLSRGMIDASGRMQPDGSRGWIRKDNSDAYVIRDDVAITQNDIRQLQLAKGAIGAGIELLCRHLSVSVSDISRVLLAGAFGNYMDPSSACLIGLIPGELENRIVPIGNAAGKGAVMCSLDAESFRLCNSLAASSGFLELASLPEFQDVFVGHMSFGDTDEDD